MLMRYVLRHKLIQRVQGGSLLFFLLIRLRQHNDGRPKLRSLHGMRRFSKGSVRARKGRFKRVRVHLPPRTSVAAIKAQQPCASVNVSESRLGECVGVACSDYLHAERRTGVILPDRSAPKSRASGMCNVEPTTVRLQGAPPGKMRGCGVLDVLSL